MADENKIQFDVELNQDSVEASFKAVDERATKSAKESAAVFGEYFQKQEQELQESISRIVKTTKDVATKSASESAKAFEEAFRKQDSIYKASVKQSLDNAIKAITNADTVKKSAQESASVFEEAFKKQITGFKPLDNVLNSILPAGGGALGTFGRIAGPLAGVTAGFLALKKAAELSFNAILEGEQKLQLERRFQAFATQAGVAADVLRNDLGKAVKGLVDDDALLKLASESFIRIGENAKQLPQILELARKTYKVFGGDIVSNAEAIQTAIETGNKKGLRSIGLYTDLDQAVKAYARQLGTVPQLLTEQQVEQARLNAILQVGQGRFKNVGEGGNEATDAVTRLKIATKELNDQLSIAASNTFGKTLAGWAEGATNFFKAINKSLDDSPKGRIDALSADIQRNQQIIENYKTSIANFSELEKFLDKGFAAGRVRLLSAELEKQIKLRDELSASVKKESDAQTEAMKAAAKAGGGEGVSSQVNDEFIRRKADLTAKVQELNNQQAQSELQLAQKDFEAKKSRANLEVLYYQQKLTESQNYEQQKAQLEKFYADNGVADESLRQQGREALEAAHFNRMLALQQQYSEQKKQIFSETETQIISTGQAFNEMTQGMNDAAADLSVNASKNFRSMGRSMLQTLAQAAGQAFAAFGAAIANGENALEAFGKSLLNSLGQAAIQMGSTFMLQGLAYTYAGLANGPPLIAAGAALAAAGGFLAASGGTGPRDVSGGGVTGGDNGGIDDTTSPIADVIAPEDTVAQIPQTAVNLTINGNVLDRRETGLEIAKILEEQFSEQGLVVRGA